jgi:hypothetical protein
MNTLYSARLSDDEEYSLAERRISGECREMQDEISTLPPGVLRVLSPRLAKEFVKSLSRSSFPIVATRGKIYTSGDKVSSACTVVFRSVLNRYIQRLEPDTLSDKFGLLLLFDNLDSVPQLVELSLDPMVMFGYSELLASMVHHLTNLQILKYPSYCTDKIILQLRLHCPNLTYVDFNMSRNVTNSSVEHLLELKKLKILKLEGTRIDVEHYGLLLSNLPQIANVSFLKVGDAILAHITAEQLDTITRISGSFQNIHALTQKFPNTTNISLYGYSTILPAMTDFRALHVVEIVGLDYEESAMSAILLKIGHRLTDLKLEDVRRINLQEIVTLCPSLISLSLNGCTDLNPNQNKPFDSQLPHFRNLINLTISNIFRPSVALGFIRYYVSLKTIYLTDISTFTAEFVRDIISLGNLTQLEVFHIRSIDQSPITMEAVQLLLQHCSLLKRIEGLAKSLSLDGNLIVNLEREILEQNFDLAIE